MRDPQSPRLSTLTNTPVAPSTSLICRAAARADAATLCVVVARTRACDEIAFNSRRHRSRTGEDSNWWVLHPARYTGSADFRRCLCPALRRAGPVGLKFKLSQCPDRGSGFGLVNVVALQGRTWPSECLHMKPEVCVGVAWLDRRYPACSYAGIGIICAATAIFCARRRARALFVQSPSWERGNFRALATAPKWVRGFLGSVISAPVPANGPRQFLLARDWNRGTRRSRHSPIFTSAMPSVSRWPR